MKTFQQKGKMFAIKSFLIAAVLAVFSFGPVKPMKELEDIGLNSNADLEKAIKIFEDNKDKKDCQAAYVKGILSQVYFKFTSQDNPFTLEQIHNAFDICPDAVLSPAFDDFKFSGESNEVVTPLVAKNEIVKAYEEEKAKSWVGKIGNIFKKEQQHSQPTTVQPAQTPNQIPVEVGGDHAPTSHVVSQQNISQQNNGQNNNIVANKDNIVFHFFKTLCGTPIKGATYLVKETYNFMWGNRRWRTVALVYGGVPCLVLFGGGIYFFYYNGTCVGYFTLLKSTAVSGLSSFVSGLSSLKSTAVSGLSSLPYIGKYFEKSQYPCDTGTVCLNQNAENLFTNTCPNPDYQEPADSTLFSRFLENLKFEWIKKKFGRQQQNQAVAGKQVDYEKIEIDQEEVINIDEPAGEEGVPNPQTNHEGIGGWIRDHLF